MCSVRKKYGDITGVKTWVSIIVMMLGKRMHVNRMERQGTRFLVWKVIVCFCFFYLPLVVLFNYFTLVKKKKKELVKAKSTIISGTETSFSTDVLRA